MPVQIYVEGIADLKFLKDFIEYHFFEKRDLGRINKNETKFESSEGNFSILAVNGIGKLKNLMTNIRASFESGNKIIFIFDADENFAMRKSEIQNILQDGGLKEFKIFLFPNNQDNGDLEDLLIQLIKDREILDCFQAYEFCLETKGNYHLPLKKTRIFVYLDALLEKSQKEKTKEINRDYKNEVHWNVNDSSAEELKKFLQDIFNK